MKISSRRILALAVTAGLGALVACNADSGVSVAPSPTPTSDSGSFVDAQQMTDSNALGLDSGDARAVAFRALLEIEDQRLLGDARIAQILNSNDTALRARAIDVLGQLRDDSQAPALIALLGRAEPAEVRVAAAGALEWMPSPEVLALMQNLARNDASMDVREVAVRALGTLGSQADIALLSQTLEAPTTTPNVFRAASLAMSRLALDSSTKPWEQISEGAIEKMYASLMGPDLPTRSFNALTLYAMLVIANPYSATFGPRIVSDWAKFNDAPSRMWLACRLPLLKAPGALELAKASLTTDPDSTVRSYLVQCLPRDETSPETMNALLSLASGADSHVAVDAIDSGFGGRLTAAAGKLSELRALYNSAPSSNVKAALFRLLQRLDTDGAAANADIAAASSDGVLRAAGINVVAKRIPATHMQAILTAASSTDGVVRNAAQTALEQTIPEPALDVTGAKGWVRSSLASADTRWVFGALKIVRARKWAEFAPDVVTAMRAARSNEAEILVTGLDVLKTLGATSQVSFIEGYIANDLPWVGKAAAEAFDALSAPPAPDAGAPSDAGAAGDAGSSLSRVRSRIRVSKPTPSDEEIRIALAGAIEFETSRGTARMKLTPSNPLGAAHYAATARAGELDGVRVHRDISAFVAQFGDPSFTGEGATTMATRTRRDYSFDHAPGTVAVARSYFDDDSSQIFFSRGSNSWLNGAYTPLGQIVEGRAFLEALEYGDTIVRVRFVPAP